jgi:hypothetical protein
MSTKLHDLPTNALLGVSLSADTITEDATGEPVDLIEGEGTCFLLAPANALGTPSPVAIAAEESNDEVTWTAVTVTPALTVSSPFNGVRVGRFERTKRYVRATVEAEEGSDVRAAVLIGQQKKTV